MERVAEIAPLEAAREAKTPGVGQPGNQMGFMKLDKAEMQRRALASRLAAKPLREIGNGPWMVLADCRATMHNTLRASRGQDFDTGEKCICPRARAILFDYRDRQSARRRSRRCGIDPDSGQGIAILPDTNNVVNYVETMIGSIPDLSGAACNSAAGRRAMDAAAGLRVENGHTERALAVAKSFCLGAAGRPRCPVLEKCGGWVLASETPAGEWGGIYGGMTVEERVERRATEDAEQRERQVAA